MKGSNRDFLALLATMGSLLELALKLLVLACGLLIFPCSSIAQNHNPYFEVSDIHFGGTDYVIIPLNANATPVRSKVTMTYRDGSDADNDPDVPTEGSTTLSWEGGEGDIVVFEGNSQLILSDHSWDDTDQGVKNLGLEAVVGAMAGNKQTLQAIYTNSDNNVTLIGQNEFTLLKVGINEVGFDSADGDTNYIQITKDTDHEFEYSKPHWVDANEDGDSDDTDDKNYPVAYVRNTYPKVEANAFVIGADLSSETIEISCFGPGDIEFSMTGTPTATDSGSSVAIAATESSGAFVNTIKYYDANTNGNEFSLQWNIKIGDSGWLNIGETLHTLYLTRDAPSNTLHLQETLFYLGCKNADGLGEDEESVVTSVYSDFTDQDVCRAHSDVSMTYYESSTDPYNTPSGGLRTLLSTNNGRCGAFSELFRHALAVQGITANYVDVKADGKYSSDPVAYEAEFGEELTEDVDVRNVFFIKDWTYTNYEFNPTDEEGVSAIGNSNPIAVFGDHALVAYGDKIYDPSYGSGPHDDVAAWEDASIVAYGLQYELQVSPLVHKLWVGEDDEMGVRNTN